MDGKRIWVEFIDGKFTRYTVYGPQLLWNPVRGTMHQGPGKSGLTIWWIETDDGRRVDL